MKLKIGKTSCYKKDIKVPKGYRLIEDWECLKEQRTNKELKNLLIKEYVWVNNKELGAVSVNYYCGLFHILGDNYLYNYGRSRGVFVKKEADK